MKKRNARVTIFEKDALHAHSLNFGLGVQSTAMVLKVLNKELPLPDCIIFSDPKWENNGSYENLNLIRPMIKASGIPFHEVSYGDIRLTALESKQTEMPFYVNSSD